MHSEATLLQLVDTVDQINNGSRPIRIAVSFVEVGQALPLSEYEAIPVFVRQNFWHHHQPDNQA